MTHLTFIEKGLMREYKEAQRLSQEGKSFRTRYRRAVMGAENPIRAFPEGKYPVGGLPDIERRPSLVQEHVLEVQPEPELVAERVNPLEVGAGIVGLATIGLLPVVGYLGYKVIRKIGENVFGRKEEEK